MIFSSCTGLASLFDGTSARSCAKDAEEDSSMYLGILKNVF